MRERAERFPLHTYTHTHSLFYLLRSLRPLRYTAEVGSGSLEWGLTHSEKFWRENATCMEANDFRTLKMLIALLDSQDEDTATIACYVRSTPAHLPNRAGPKR